MSPEDALSNSNTSHYGAQRTSSQDSGEVGESLAHLAAIDICRVVSGTAKVRAIGEIDLGDRSELQGRGVDRLAALDCPQPHARDVFLGDSVERRASKRLAGR